MIKKNVHQINNKRKDNKLMFLYFINLHHFITKCTIYTFDGIKIKCMYLYFIITYLVSEAKYSFNKFTFFPQFHYFFVTLPYFFAWLLQFFSFYIIQSILISIKNTRTKIK